MKNNIVKERTIKTGAELDMAVEVLDGLTKDEKIIINPSDRIKEGVKVRIIEEREV